MAGGRKKGRNKAKVKNLSLGDLVLAKVKGSPFWPAKISRPEDWEREPDPERYFVQFFGTQEIAFVTPADVQAFTSETTSKLSEKCQAKHKFFVQAVKEICEAFDELQKEKSSGLRDETDRSTRDGEASSADRAEVDGAEVDLKNGTGALASGGETTSVGKGDLASNLEHRSHRGENDGEDIKPSISGHADGSSSVMSSEGKQKVLNGDQPKQEVLSPSSLDEPSHRTKEFSGDKIATVNSTKKTLRDDQKLKKMPKKRTEVLVGGHESSSSAPTFLGDEKSGRCLDRNDSEEQLKDRTKGKVSGSSMKISLQMLLNRIAETKGNFKPTDDLRNTLGNSKGETTGKRKRGDPGLGKPND